MEVVVRSERERSGLEVKEEIAERTVRRGKRQSAKSGKQRVKKEGVKEEESGRLWPMEIRRGMESGHYCERTVIKEKKGE